MADVRVFHRSNRQAGTSGPHVLGRADELTLHFPTPADEVTIQLSDLTTYNATFNIVYKQSLELRGD